MADPSPEVESSPIELEDRGSKGRYFLRSIAGEEAEMTFTKISDTDKLGFRPAVFPGVWKRK